MIHATHSTALSKTYALYPEYGFPTILPKKLPMIHATHSTALSKTYALYPDSSFSPTSYHICNLKCPTDTCTHDWLAHVVMFLTISKKNRSRYAGQTVTEAPLSTIALQMSSLPLASQWKKMKIPEKFDAFRGFSYHIFMKC